MQLIELLNYCNNFFIRDTIHDMFVIRDGKIEIATFLVDHLPLVGQYIEIKGSVLNDNVYKVKKIELDEDGYDDYIVVETPLLDETFTGVINYLMIPQNFIYIFNEISQSQEKNSNVSSETTPHFSQTFFDPSVMSKRDSEKLRQYRKLKY